MSDDQLRLLTEIRDILQGQTEMVQSHWRESQRQARKCMIANFICFFPFTVLVAWLIMKDF